MHGFQDREKNQRQLPPTYPSAHCFLRQQGGFFAGGLARLSDSVSRRRDEVNFLNLFSPSLMGANSSRLLSSVLAPARASLAVFVTRMKKSLVFALFAAVLAPAVASPIRVLYLGTPERTPRMTAHVLMRDLGRDAIWFDYVSDPGDLTPSFLAKFDLVVLDAAPDAYRRALGDIAAAKQIPVSALGSDPTSESFAATAKPKLLAAVGRERAAAWEAFLAQREPERREPRPTIANYEKRAEPVTYQFPLGIKGSMERTQVAPDLKLQLFAAEPDIAKPIFLAWDERGRLWIAETRDYPHHVQPDGRGNDSIKICEDTDGDGRADKFTVFADHLNIPTGFVFSRGGIVVAQAPRFLFLKDNDGDDRADERREIMSGWGINDTHAQANNLHYGIDNWLYGAVGYSGFRGSVGGRDLQFMQGTYRLRPDGSALEFLHQFTNNTWGHSENQFGDQFGGTANNAPLFFGGIPATILPRGLRGMTAKRINTEDKTHTITPNFRQVDVFGGYTAAAGSAFIYSEQLPARLQGMVMICEPTMKNIALFDVQRDGAGYVAHDAFNLVASSDEWMSPVFAEVGPDGAVWFADWQNYIIQHNPTPNLERGGYAAKTGVGGAHENPLRDNQRGRIYRVVGENAKPAAIKSLARADTARLIAALGDANPFWRLTAQRLLVDGQRTDAIPALKRLVAAAAPLPALHALWTLHGLGHLDEATHRGALSHPDSAVRRNATRALGRDASAVSLFFASAVMSDPDLLTRLAAFVKLAEFPTSPEIKTVIASLVRNPANQKDEWLSEATRLLGRVHGATLFREGPNLLPNAGFETVAGSGLPEGWTRRDNGTRPGNASAAWSTTSAEKQFHAGRSAMRIAAETDADTSLHTEVPVKPNTMYRLAGWIKTHALAGRVNLTVSPAGEWLRVARNANNNRIETEPIRRRDTEWTQVEVDFNSGERTTATINLQFTARGEAFFDEVRLAELVPAESAVAVTAGDVKRGEFIFHKHPAACVLCHQLNGQGSAVGPALDRLAARATPAYIRESLLEPSKVLAKGFEQMKISPMPPMADIFSPQEISDLEAYLQTLK
jgi:putative membrane-bound dehydrogenase-like protein